VSLLREYEPRDFDGVRPLREAPARCSCRRPRAHFRSANHRGAAASGRASHCTGCVPEVPQIISRGEQILRLVWYPFACNRSRSGSLPSDSTTRAGRRGRAAASGCASHSHATGRAATGASSCPRRSAATASSRAAHSAAPGRCSSPAADSS